MLNAVEGIKSKLDDAASALKRKIDEVIGKVEAACFVAGTKILTVSGYKSIEDIQIGDVVLSRDEESGQIDYKSVNQVFVNQVDTIYELEIDGVEIETTASHPFYVQGKGFVGAKYLKQTDLLLSASGDTLRIDSYEVKKYDELVTVYNFEVEDYHTYFASTVDVFVHNTCAQPVKGSLAELLEGTGKYADVKGHHPLAKTSFKNSSKYDFNKVFSVSPAKLDEVSGIPNVHAKITGQQNSLYTQWVKNNKNTKLTLSEMAKIEKQSMINAGIPERFANGWVDQAFKELKDLGITDADITNIPWNGVNP